MPITFVGNVISGVSSELAVVDWFCAEIAIQRLREMQVDCGYVWNVKMRVHVGGNVDGRSLLNG